MNRANKKTGRRNFVSALKNPETSDILEIGALNSPTFLESEANVKFADWTTYENLVANNPHKDRIRQVDYVISDRELSAAIEQKFDVVIANHVVEHIPDIIFWLQQLAEITRSDGVVTLAVPDRRYTFDIFRRETNLADLLGCYATQLTNPSFEQVFSHQYYYQKVDSAAIWDGEEVIQGPPRYKAADAYRKTMRMMGEYHSVHCHVFTYETFAALFAELEQTGLIPWKLVTLEPVQRGLNEFLVGLRKLEG